MKRRITAWLAIGAMALNAAWPSLIQARPKVVDLPLELCSSGVLQTGEQSGAPVPASPPADTHALQHCALCGASAADRLTAPSGEHRFFVPVQSVRASPPPAATPRIESLTYLPARPRAPPTVA